MSDDGVRLRGDRVSLRPTSPDDLDLLTGWLTDPEVYRWWGGRAHSREEVAAKYIGARSPDVEGFIVEVETLPIGYLQYWIESETSGGLDMFLIPSARGKGLGPEAARLLAGYLFDVRGWTRITVDPLATNAGAIRGWERAGFRYERDMPDHPDGPSVLLSWERHFQTQ